MLFAATTSVVVTWWFAEWNRAFQWSWNSGCTTSRRRLCVCVNRGRDGGMDGGEETAWTRLFLLPASGGAGGGMGWCRICGAIGIIVVDGAVHAVVLVGVLVARGEGSCCTGVVVFAVWVARKGIRGCAGAMVIFGNLQLGRKFAGCSQLACASVALSLVAPGCNSAAALSMASGDRVMALCISWHVGSAQTPQKSSQQQVFIGMPVALMGAGMLLPPSLSTRERGLWGLRFALADVSGIFLREWWLSEWCLGLLAAVWELCHHCCWLGCQGICIHQL